MLILQTILVGALLCFIVAGDDSLQVCLPKLGCLQGTLKPGHLTDEFEAFMGIPFAKPPVGELRLKNPVPIEPWSEVLDASKPKDLCLQKSLFMPKTEVIGAEDCLYLNVYRSKTRKSDKLPVMLYIHGGGYYSGSPNILEPDYLMAVGEVIVVTTAYRLGPFGFLSTGDENMPGNFGLKDQSVALKWVHDNIAAFGGDPDLVTIFGHSAGGSSVHQHMLSQTSRGLFQRAMSFSGSAFASFAKPVKEPLAQARHVATLCNIADADKLTTSDLAEHLRTLDAHTLVNVVDHLHSIYRFPLFYFRPVIEKSEWKDAFLTECPVKAQMSGNFAQVPWLVSTLPNVGEGAFATIPFIENEERRNDLNSDFPAKISQIMDLPKDLDKQLLVSLFAEYTNGVHQLNNDTYRDISSMFGDYYFYYPFYKTIKLFVEHADPDKSPLYVLDFIYKGYYSYAKFMFGGSERDFGAVHLDDTIYMFYIPLLFPKGMGTDSPCAKTKHRMIRLLVDFAKTGKIISPTNVGACTATQMNNAKDNGICDMLTIDNHADTFQENIGKELDIKAKSIWQQIYGY